MWESLSIIFLILALVCLVIAVINFLISFSVHSFLNKKESEIRNTDNKAIDQVADSVINELSKLNVILMLLFKIGIIKKIVKNAAKKGAIEAIIKVIKRIRTTTLIFGLAFTLSVLAAFSLSNSFYTLDIASNTATSILQNLFRLEKIDEQVGEEEGWQWDSSTDVQINTGGASSGNNSPGNATGQYAIELDDGTYYWYHQSKTCNCVNDVVEDGIRTSTLIANSGTMASRGCSVYSSAIALSNLLGQEITPIDFIRNVLGSTIEKQSNGSYRFTASGKGITFGSDSVSTDKKTWAESIVEVYGSQGVCAKAVNVKSQAEVDEILNKGGYIITSFNRMDFPWHYRSSAGSHYMIIRKKDASGNYYCFNSCSGGRVGHPGAVESMTTGVSWDMLKSSYTHSDGVAVWGEGIQYTTETTDSSGDASQIEIGINDKVFDILSNDSRYKSKAKTLAMVYDIVIKAGYEHNFAVGLVANIYHEGNFGYIEGINFKTAYQNGDYEGRLSTLSCGCSKNGVITIDYWHKATCAAHELAGKKITNIDMVNAMLTIPNDVGGIGVGILQWSGSRRVTMLNMYAQHGSSLTSDLVVASEVAMMMQEFKGGYSSVVTKSQGASVEDCCENITRDFLKPGDTDKAVQTRRATASEMKKLLGGT